MAVRSRAAIVGALQQDNPSDFMSEADIRDTYEAGGIITESEAWGFLADYWTAIEYDIGGRDYAVTAQEVVGGWTAGEGGFGSVGATTGGGFFGQGESPTFAGGGGGVGAGGELLDEAQLGTIFNQYLNQIGGLPGFQQAAAQQFRPLESQFLLQSIPDASSGQVTAAGGAQQFGQFLRGQTPFGRLTGDALQQRLVDLAVAISNVEQGGATQGDIAFADPFTGQENQIRNVSAAGLGLMGRAGSGRARSVFADYLNRLANEFYANNPGKSFLNEVVVKNPFGGF